MSTDTSGVPDRPDPLHPGIAHPEGCASPIDLLATNRMTHAIIRNKDRCQPILLRDAPLRRAFVAPPGSSPPATAASRASKKASTSRFISFGRAGRTPTSLRFIQDAEQRPHTARVGRIAAPGVAQVFPESAWLRFSTNASGTWVSLTPVAPTVASNSWKSSHWRCWPAPACSTTGVDRAPHSCRKRPSSSAGRSVVMRSLRAECPVSGRQ